MHDLYDNQDCGQRTSDGLLFIRRLGDRSSRVFSSGRPFQIDQLHIGIVTSGEQDVTVNLRQYHLTKGLLLVASPESIMQENRRTENFDMQVIHVNDELLRRLFGDQIPLLFTHRMNNLLLYLDEAVFELLQTMLNTLWKVIHTDFESSRDHLLVAILSLITDLSKRDKQNYGNHQPRNVAVFNRFLSLVAEHCDSQRTLNFYADKLCLSKQYLGNIIMEVSHRTAHEWIDEATIARIKVMLLHSTTTLNEISERMSFAEPSHFSRYFKRLTGFTPIEYRKSNKNSM